MIDNLHVTLETTHIELHPWYRKGQREQHLYREPINFLAS